MQIQCLWGFLGSRMTSWARTEKVSTYNFILLSDPHSLTQRHDGEVFPSELAGQGDLLSEGPAPI